MVECASFIGWLARPSGYIVIHTLPEKIDHQGNHVNHGTRYQRGREAAKNEFSQGFDLIVYIYNTLVNLYKKRHK